MSNAGTKLPWMPSSPHVRGSCAEPGGGDRRRSRSRRPSTLAHGTFVMPLVRADLSFRRCLR